MSLISYIVNWEELLINLNDKLDGKTYRSLRDIKGKQRIKGFAESIPALEGTFRVAEMTWDKNIILTGATFSQSAWKGEDYWSFWVDDDMLFDEIYTKEIGDQKHWELIHVVKAGETAKFLIHNISGNSRNVWVDLEWVELIEELEGGCPVEPDIPVDPEPNPEEPVEPTPPPPTEPTLPTCEAIKQIDFLVEPRSSPDNPHGNLGGVWKTVTSNNFNKAIDFVGVIRWDIKIDVRPIKIDANKFKIDIYAKLMGDSLNELDGCCIIALKVHFKSQSSSNVKVLDMNEIHFILDASAPSMQYESFAFSYEGNMCDNLIYKDTPH